MKSKQLIVANWKMNPDSLEAARKIFLDTRRVAQKLKKTEVIVCPPAVFFGTVAKLAVPKVHLGVQNIFWESQGPYTGEMSAKMVLNAGGKYTIIGHSERRELGETTEMINKKVIAALSNDLKVILCIGEKERDSQGNYLNFIKQEISSALSGIQKKFIDNLVIAYEPVWAIGKSEREAMKGADMYEMLLYIKKIIAEMLGREYADSVPILYGGSVTSANAKEIMEAGHVDGLLVGRQSLDPVLFKDLLLSVDSVKNS